MADEQLRFAISFVVGVGPAILLMWVSLRRFDHPYAPKTLFDDRRVFLAFAVGMGFGALSSSLTFAVSTSGLGIVFPLIAVALFEESFKLVYLNRKGYRGRFDTTFYGVSLGVGSAATLVMASVFNANPTLLQSPEVPALIAALVLLSLSMTMVLASTGAIIGFGTSQSKVLGYFVRAFLVRFSHLAILLFFFVAPPDEAVLGFSSLGASLIFAGVVYAFVYREILPETLPKDIRRSLRRFSGKAERPTKDS
ncbi:MAG: hypothetical protein E6K10_06255 [Methanobacteriota archaeon]|nr:MAG: hypothetical protein E6K10_06255 [Euryarchaeota archaeon]